MTLLTPAPKSSPTQSPLPGAGASKKVVRLPSIAFSFVLPLLLKEPLVPMIVPESLISARAVVRNVRSVRALSVNWDEWLKLLKLFHNYEKKHGQKRTAPGRAKP